LIYRDEALLAVGDILLPGIDLGNATAKHNPLYWKRSEFLCGY
jgi:hypothetical protein